MSFDLPANLDRDIQRFAETHHISHEEALVTLIKTGLSASAGKGNDRPDNPSHLIGFLSSAPEVAVRIREIATERRTEMFDRSA